ncbi:hypothetical protein [Hyalangium rubrum]|uniref:Lipoprotein n=1 Tax=Hyalangium rubrum TaxID=3103134 RepID=A0ABU5HJB8_9BACT|nr:hypothetical protein [Hyalangium sp. s54d21]MDY7233257.1 hypothetical protein [Hyalangium sp. s54d21]
MRWMTVGLAALALVGNLGCSRAKGKKSTFDKAAFQGVEQSIADKACSKHEYEEHCTPDPTLPRCRQLCG